MRIYSQGPWQADCPSGESVFTIHSADDLTVAETYNTEDARLIATAPELLEAAQKALQVAESWIHDQLDGTSSLEEALAELDPVRKTIAKATGE